jgi:hypothetical protein
VREYHWESTMHIHTRKPVHGGILSTGHRLQVVRTHTQLHTHTHTQIPPGWDGGHGRGGAAESDERGIERC